MKKLLCFAATLLFAFQTYAQDAASHPLSIGVSALIGRPASITDFYFPVDGKLSPAFDIHLVYGCSKSLSLQAGLGMERFNYTEHGFFFPSSFDPQTGWRREVYMDMHLNYLSLPLKVNFMPGAGKFHFLASGGITPALLLGARRKVYTKDGISDPEIDALNQRPDITNTYHKFTVLPNISLGAAYQVNQNLLLNAGLGFEYGIIPPSGDINHMMCLGLNIGAAWRIR